MRKKVLFTVKQNPSKMIKKQYSDDFDVFYYAVYPDENTSLYILN